MLKTDDAVIRCEQLTKRYPGHVMAVDRLDLSVKCGEIFGLLGPNGAGKTTTIGMLTTLVVPTAGRAAVAGIDVVSHPSMVKQLIGTVSQVNNLDRSLTVWENLYYHGRFFGMGARESREAADKSLVEFRLSERAKSDVATISGGMARRLQVARALIHNPSVLFLDEPTAGLDPQSRIALWDILRRLHTSGQTILLTTHNMEEADSACDRLAIMDRGRLLAIDSPKNLKKTVGADTIVTVSSDGDLDALARRLQDRVEGATRSRQIDGVVQLQVKGRTGVLPRVVSVAEQEGFAITDLSLAEPTLETVFINLTGKELRD
ncbi:MAG: daunorubicin ABC transporter ATP-binding protein [Chloroflexi bacterium RBG_16_56_11]|nr:MAG: daunorubicin ABC transporter ATP-binding protein [Chloroflexi bacterium RBG_16_56_11]